MADFSTEHNSRSERDEETRQGRWLLAIDTSTDQAGIALYDGSALAEMSWPGGRRQTTGVLPAVDSMMGRVGIGLADVGAVAVASGPGSFTGLRVGLSIAKGLAIVENRAVIGVPTLDIAASPYREAGVPCIVLVPAGRGRVVWAHYPTHGAATEPRNTTFDDLVVEIQRHPDVIVCGELNPDQQAAVRSVHQHLSSVMVTRRPGVLAEIGYRRWQLGDVDDPALLEPQYLHGQPNPR